MRVQPVKHYRPPALPLAAWTKADPAEHAARCGRVLRLMAGAGLLGSSWLAAVGGRASSADAPAEIPARPDTPPASGADANGQATPTQDDATETFFRLAPNLLETMKVEGLGRGGTGCVAMDPANFINEEDGVAIVRAELEKAGLVFAEANPENVAPGTAPILPMPSSIKSTRGRYLAGKESEIAKEIIFEPMPFVFDAVSADGRVLVEFISTKNVDDWWDQRLEIIRARIRAQEEEARKRSEKLEKLAFKRSKALLFDFFPFFRIMEKDLDRAYNFRPRTYRSIGFSYAGTTATGANLIDPALEFADMLSKTPDAEGRVVILVCDPSVRRRLIWDKLPPSPYMKRKEYPTYPKREAFDTDEEHRKAAYSWEKDPQYQADSKAWHAEFRRVAAEITAPHILKQLVPQIAFLREQGILPPVPEATMEPEDTLPIIP